MTALRLSRWIILLAALIASVSWSYVAINHLLESSTTQQEIVSEYNPTPKAPSVHLHQMDLAQRHWGQQTMFALGCSIAFLLAAMINWAVDGRRRPGGELR